MIGVLIITHGDLAQGLISASELIMGKAENLDYLGLYHETSIEVFNQQVAEKILALDTGEGVLVFCDIFGASPYNSTALNYKELKDKVNYRAITGVNLPMVIEALSMREFTELAELSKTIQKIGKEGINELFELIERSEKNG